MSARRIGDVDRVDAPASPGAWDARSEAWLTGRQDVDAEVGETKVVDVQPGETRVVDIQLGEARIAAARNAWDAVTVTAEPSPPDEQPLPQSPGPQIQGPASSSVPASPSAPALARGAAQFGTPVASDRMPTAPSTETPSVRRGAADPVKALMHRHRELCERAVDPLEIAAGLEAHGVTDRTATRYRHRDVFSLAEEMYARVPRAGDTAARSEAPDIPRARADWAVRALLPGALCAAVVAGLRYTEGRPRLAVTVGGVLVVALALRAALGRGPLHAARAWTPTGFTRAWTCWLVAYALLGDGMLSAGIEGGPAGLPTGGPDSPWPIALASVLALTAACAPAAWCAHLFSVRARRRLAGSRALEEFAASVRPLLLGVFGLFLCALGGLLALSGAVLDEPAAYAGAGALGALLLLARLLTVHGFTHAPAVVVASAGVAETAALVSVYAGRLPGCRVLAVPVETVTDAWGAGAVPALVCGGAALVLLLHATRTLTRASAHAVRGETP
ncbi:hypothetical protein ACLVWQ_08110 [Streptomyces sp. CWNU-52B]|uniref:hypothetical protein n=1 Tax=unclassified Streptomyces TaxID=2593676 RepID=UPI0039BFAE2A